MSRSLFSRTKVLVNKAYTVWTVSITVDNNLYVHSARFSNYISAVKFQTKINEALSVDLSFWSPIELDALVQDWKIVNNPMYV